MVTIASTAAASATGVVPDEITYRSAILATLRLIEPESAAAVGKCRVGARADGGYVMLDDLDGISVCYSLGVGQDVSWDLAMARRGALIRQYDHTVGGPPVAHPLFRHRPIGIAHDDALRPHMRRLDSLMRENGDAARQDMILKVDIEGHEWRALGVIGPVDLACFRQIVVEFHGLGLLALPSFRQRAHDVFARLLAGHSVVHVHGNNFAGMTDAAGIVLPDCIEITFANRRRYCFAASADIFPGPLDAANNTWLPDLRLGSFKAADFKVKSRPGRALSIFEFLAERATESSEKVVALPAYLLAAAQEELGALAEMHRPARPPRDAYCLGHALLDEAIGICDRHRIWLDDSVANGLGRAIRHLRARIGGPSGDWHADPETVASLACLSGFLHFHASWEHHPLFPGMLACLATQGFSLQGLSLFAAAYCLAVHGAHVSFPIEAGAPTMLDHFSLADGPAQSVVVHVCNLGAIGAAGIWGSDTLYRDVEAQVATVFPAVSACRRGMLVLFGGVAVRGLEHELIESVKRALHAHGRRNPNLMAVASLVFNVRIAQDGVDLYLDYGFIPIANGHLGSTDSSKPWRNTSPGRMLRSSG